jgi:hypothetical protein
LLFLDISISFYEFWNLLIFLGLNKSENDFLIPRKVAGLIRSEAIAHGARRPSTPSRSKGWLGLGLEAQSGGEAACGTETTRVHRARSRRDHRAQLTHATVR